jgi:hypothetical protein
MLDYCTKFDQPRSVVGRQRKIGKTTKVNISCFFICTYIALSLYLRRGSRGILDIRDYIRDYISSDAPKFYQNCLAMSNTADVTVGKPIAV